MKTLVGYFCKLIEPAEFPARRTTSANLDTPSSSRIDWPATAQPASRCRPAPSGVCPTFSEKVGQTPLGAGRQRDAGCAVAGQSIRLLDGVSRLAEVVRRAGNSAGSMSLQK